MTRLGRRDVTLYLGSCINLTLPHILSLAQNSSRQKPVPILVAAQEIRRLEEDGRPVVPG